MNHKVWNFFNLEFFYLSAFYPFKTQGANS